MQILFLLIGRLLPAGADAFKFELKLYLTGYFEL